MWYGTVGAKTGLPVRTPLELERKLQLLLYVLVLRYAYAKLRELNPHSLPMQISIRGKCLCRLSLLDKLQFYRAGSCTHFPLCARV